MTNVKLVAATTGYTHLARGSPMHTRMRVLTQAARPGTQPNTEPETIEQTHPCDAPSSSAGGISPSRRPPFPKPPFSITSKLPSPPLARPRPSRGVCRRASRPYRPPTPARPRTPRLLQRRARAYCHRRRISWPPSLWLHQSDPETSIPAPQVASCRPTASPCQHRALPTEPEPTAVAAS